MINNDLYELKRRIKDVRDFGHGEREQQQHFDEIDHFIDDMIKDLEHKCQECLYQAIEDNNGDIVSKADSCFLKVNK